MHSTHRSHVRQITAACCGLVLFAGACGSDGADAVPAETAAQTVDEMEPDMDMDMDMDPEMAMNMGDPDATPADDVDDAALARGTFVLLDTRPQGYDDAAGSAVIARSPAGTTVTVELNGLPPNVDYIAHVHAEPCAPDNGGPHYQFDVGGSTVPPNEIHLAFTSDDDGVGFMTAENDAIAGVDAQALVVHPAEFLDNKVACVDFVEDRAGAAAGMIDDEPM
ncbi:MAG: superoxide dismutase family protein [Ilumatobacter sp.]|nr:superoxide dismutase family protein [Ilumatobacter sp.]